MNFKSIFSKGSLSQDQKQQILISVFIVVIFATLMVLYFGFWRSSPAPSDPDSQTPGVTKGQSINLEKIDFDVSFLKTSRFQDLNIYGKWPLEIEEKGRQNPFLPYNQ